MKNELKEEQDDGSNEDEEAVEDILKETPEEADIRVLKHELELLGKHRRLNQKSSEAWALLCFSIVAKAEALCKGPQSGGQRPDLGFQPSCLSTHWIHGLLRTPSMGSVMAAYVALP